MSSRGNQLDPRVLQSYLQALALCRVYPDRRLANRELVQAYLELQFQLHGGSSCALCGLPVRHVIPVTCEREDGSISEYECLCKHCIESEKNASSAVYSKVGRVTIYFENSGEVSFGEPIRRPQTSLTPELL